MVTPQSVQGHTGVTHHFLIFDIRALWRSGLSAREPECQKFKKMVGYTSMVLNALVDSFCYSQKNAGLKGLMFVQRPGLARSKCMTYGTHSVAFRPSARRN